MAYRLLVVAQRLRVRRSVFSRTHMPRRCRLLNRIRLSQDRQSKPRRHRLRDASILFHIFALHKLTELLVVAADRISSIPSNQAVQHLVLELQVKLARSVALLARYYFLLPGAASAYQDTHFVGRRRHHCLPRIQGHILQNRCAFQLFTRADDRACQSASLILLLGWLLRMF